VLAVLGLVIGLGLRQDCYVYSIMYVRTLPTPITISNMATLADELLNDFEDSGSEEDDRQNGFLQDGATPPATDGRAHAENGSMVLDGDEEDIDEDEEMAAAAEANDVAGADDEEEAKAKVEKMQLGGVSDVRNVAGLMKTLEPVLQVRAYIHTLSTCR